MSASGLHNPIDAVYTWVDGAWPGYNELLNRYAANRHDLNPNRYRDNLSTLKFSLRSLQQFLPWIRRVFLVTCRPQVPPWLDTSAVAVVHHDEFMPPSDLPTFNSFAIVSNLHRIPNLSQRFLYIEDDHLFGSAVGPEDLFDAGGAPRIYAKLDATRWAKWAPAADASPWTHALAYSTVLLDEKYGRKRRLKIQHTPIAIEVDSWTEMIRTWPAPFRSTSSSRFRARGNVAPEHLYPQFLLEEQRGVRVPLATAYRHAAYHPLNNVSVFQRLGFARLRRQAPKFLCLNDNFGSSPNERVVSMIRRTLEAWFPERSRFERQQAGMIGDMFAVNRPALWPATKTRNHET